MKNIVQLLTSLVFSLFFVSLTLSSASAQNNLRIKVTDSKKAPLSFVTVGGKGSLLGTTDSMGFAVVSVPSGQCKITFQIIGFKTLDTSLNVTGSMNLNIRLESEESQLEEVTFVASTRTNQRIENSTMKVEVLGAEELGEESSVQPGNIGSLLSDVSGVQIQQTSATSGNNSVRIQGLDGKYTQILRDGMPLYEGFSGGFGILTIPPLDLKQIELIKGAASTLYGGGAIAGLINLISKRPTFEQEADAVVNYTSLNEFNADLYLAKRNKTFGYTLFGGFNHLTATDINNDGLSDVPEAKSFILHPQLYFYPSTSTTVSIGYVGTFDDRRGGDMSVMDKSVLTYGHYFEDNNSTRHTAEYFVEHSLADGGKLTIKGNVSDFYKLTSSNYSNEEGDQVSYYDEASLFLPHGKNSLVAGLNISGSEYNQTQPFNSIFSYYHLFTAGAFAQYNWQFAENGTVETGLRIDKPTGNGYFVLPRIAGFYRVNEHWACRAGFGMGYKMPNPLDLLNNDTARNYIPYVDPGLKPELSYGYNAELNYKLKWDDNSLFINEALFMTDVERPVYDFVSGVTSSLVNLATPTVSKGSDTYMKLTLKKWELYLGYTYTLATNDYYHNTNSSIPLTAKNRMAFVVTREIEKKWKFGVEGSWFGQQYRDDGTLTPSYFLTAIMIARNVGEHFTLVLNGENLLDYRMSNYESLYTGTFTNPVFKPLWAPIDGRVINFSVRWKLDGNK